MFLKSRVKFRKLALRQMSILTFILCSYLAFCQAKEKDGANVYIASVESIVKAMDTQKGYDFLTTTNGARFHSNVLLALIDEIQKKGGGETRIFYDGENNLNAYLQKTGLPFEKLPIYVQLARENNQNEVVEFGVDRVVKQVIEGRRPKQALSIHTFWCEEENPASHFAYDDTLSVPRLRVINARDVRLKLLDFGDMLLYDEIEGMKGRPTTGLLGALFKIIGEGAIVQSRSAISDDGLQIVYARSKKGFFSVTTTATIYPDGRAIKGLPKDRPDLKKIEKRLKQPIKIEYW